MTKPNQPKNARDGKPPSPSRESLGLQPLTAEQEAFEKACDAIIAARLIAKFGPKTDFTDDEIEAVLDELEAEGALNSDKYVIQPQR